MTVSVSPIGVDVRGQAQKSTGWMEANNGEIVIKAGCRTLAEATADSFWSHGQLDMLRQRYIQPPEQKHVKDSKLFIV